MKGLRNRSVHYPVHCPDGCGDHSASQIRFLDLSGVHAGFGSVLPFFNTPATVLIHEQVEEAYLGRVFSGPFFPVPWPLSMVLFGPLADHFNINSLF